MMMTKEPETWLGNIQRAAPRVRVWDAEWNVLGDSDVDPYCNRCGLPHSSECLRGDR